MSVILNGEFHLTETWTIQGYARDHQTRPLDLSGGTVELRFAHSNGLVIFDLSTADSEGTVTDASNGQYEFVISPSDQDTANVQPGVYKYEIRVTLASGRSSIQNLGSLTIRPSLFQE